MTRDCYYAGCLLPRGHDDVKLKESDRFPHAVLGENVHVPPSELPLYGQAVEVIAEAIHWYGANPQAEASAAEVIASALATADLLAVPGG